MELTPYVDSLQRELAVAAAAGGPEAEALAERLTAPLDAAVRLRLQEAVVDAAAERPADDRGDDAATPAEPVVPGSRA